MKCVIKNKGEKATNVGDGLLELLLSLELVVDVTEKSAGAVLSEGGP